MIYEIPSFKSYVFALNYSAKVYVKGKVRDAFEARKPRLRVWGHKNLPIIAEKLKKTSGFLQDLSELVNLLSKGVEGLDDINRGDNTAVDPTSLVLKSIADEDFRKKPSDYLKPN